MPQGSELTKVLDVHEAAVRGVEEEEGACLSHSPSSLISRMRCWIRCTVARDVLFIDVTSLCIAFSWWRHT